MQTVRRSPTVTPAERCELFEDRILPIRCFPRQLKAWLTRLPLLHTWPVGILEKELANGLLSLSIHVVFMCIFSAYSYLQTPKLKDIIN